MIGLILTLAIVGLIVWAVITFIPMPPAIRTIIVVVAVVCIVVYLLQMLGLWGSYSDVPVPHVR